MGLDILIVVIVTSIIQSLFGVGVLLFGTPLLLLLGYPFMESLLILLPISASINILQIIKDYKSIEITIYKNILLITVPFIVVSLFMISKIKVDINIMVGFLLLFISIKNHIQLLNNIFEKLLSYNKVFYSTMGIVHGLTNLGGAFLTAKIFHTKLNKYEKRATTAVSYLTFALFQIITIMLLDVKYNVENLWYVLIGITTYIVIHQVFFHKINDNKYDGLFSIFLFLSGISLILKGFIW